VSFSWAFRFVPWKVTNFCTRFVMAGLRVAHITEFQRDPPRSLGTAGRSRSFFLKTQGLEIIEAGIGPDGSVSDAKVLRGGIERSAAALGVG
jgi:hypothetical protein